MAAHATMEYVTPSQETIALQHTNGFFNAVRVGAI
jgi:hypothetical protein